MVINYEPLRILMVKKKLKKMDVINKCGLSPTTASKLWNDEYVALSVIDRLCNLLDCKIEDIVEHQKDAEA